ncbi:hypothetical protein DWZ50_17085 [Mediterraneibacter gnavus]|uniref:Peptidase S8/S53 domain-containing protein n=1 Tax=Mediterraneibacter gnavus TaxID=33038 RepID=A0A415S5F2_MEDGN|nr:S8 family serine peptidase [Mediterraneibacter gnavus]RHM70665.1 hypothetical protein DWZ50_17085 [Mediterraneibacter gnavus]
MKPIVAVIDSGIDSNIVNNVTMDVLKKGEEDKCGHGTACAMIIKGIAPKADIISIPLLDENIEATSMELEKALSFCQEIDCNIINLSLSVTNLYTNNLKKICMGLYRQGKIIVSSVTNRKYSSLPASYDTVIGVRGKVFSSPMTYWFNKRDKIQLIADMTPVFTDFRLNRYFIFSGNSKAALASGVIAHYFSRGLVGNIEELNEYMMQNSEKQEWGKINFESQIGDFYAPVLLKEEGLEMIRMKIYSLLKKHITFGQDFSPEESLFNIGVITEITVKKLFESLSELFNITIDLKNISPKDIVTVNNLVLAIQRICIEQGKWYV